MELSEQLPAGFEARVSTSELWIRYRSCGIGCLLVFIAVSVGLAVAGWGLLMWLDWRALKAILVAEWWTPLAFASGLSAAVYFGFLGLWLALGTTELNASKGNLIVRKKLLGFQRERHLPREAIQYFEQIKDGGQGEDSFPSWGLVVRAPKRVRQLTRQPIEKSLWLGRVLSEFYGVEFQSSPHAPP